MLVAPSVFVGPNQFDPILIFGFTAAVLGGLDSPAGAVVGGIVLGLVLSYVSGYEGSSLVTLAALVVLIAVLMIRPGGLFSSTQGAARMSVQPARAARQPARRRRRARWCARSRWCVLAGVAVLPRQRGARAPTTTCSWPAAPTTSRCSPA